MLHETCISHTCNTQVTVNMHGSCMLYAWNMHNISSWAVIDERLIIFDLAVELEVDDTEPVQSSLTLDGTMSDERPPPKKKSKLVRILKSSHDSEQRRMTPGDKVMKEVPSYTDRPCIDVEDDPLDWWRIEYRNTTLA